MASAEHHSAPKTHRGDMYGMCTEWNQITAKKGFAAAKLAFMKSSNRSTRNLLSSSSEARGQASTVPPGCGKFAGW